VFRCFAPTIAFALVLGLVPGPGRAQTNIDQGKSPAEIFSQDCATCHKTARGLANGRSSATLAGFLVEHYTSSRDQAAALAAYVMGAGGGDSVSAAPGRGPKPAVPDRGRAALEESKPAPTRPTGRPDEARPATAKLQPPAADESRRPPAEVPSVVQEPTSPAAPGRRPATANRRDIAPPPPARNRNKREPEYSQPPAEPAAAVAEPTMTSPPVQEMAPASAPAASAAAPANGDAGTGVPIPRDDIPD
jgi:hypothetical protein